MIFKICSKCQTDAKFCHFTLLDFEIQCIFHNKIHKDCYGCQQIMLNPIKINLRDTKK